MSNPTKIPLQVDVNRVIEVLARQIYQSPLALLRENTQNAFDAVVMRKQLSSDFKPSINIHLEPTKIQIDDNGIGMTSNDLENHFWCAGSSSKNSDEARAAGVVGTFGIGAMANFGIADEITVITESANNPERTKSAARREDLSTSADCISLVPEAPTGNPGTTVVAEIMASKPLNVNDATKYIQEFVAYAEVDIYCNGTLISNQDFETAVPSIPVGWRNDLQQHKISPRLVSDIRLVGAPSGEIRISLSNIIFDGASLRGRLILRQGMNSIRTFRNGFGLATVSVSSVFSFGGAANILALVPTAGREALENDSLQLLQSIVSDIDAFVAEQLASRPESNLNTPFINWIISHGRYDFAGHVHIRCEPENTEMKLSEVAKNDIEWKYYAGKDQNLIKSFATDDTKLLVLANNTPRKRCQLGYLTKHTKAKQVSDTPQELSRKKSLELSIAESAVVFRLTTVLEDDYFLKSNICFGTITHGLPVLVEQAEKPVLIILDPDAQSMRLLLNIYDTEYGAFAGMAKDFVRNVIFPQIGHLVPSSTRQGAEAFLKSIRKRREVFEIESSEMSSLGGIWESYLGGDITMEEVEKRSIAIVRQNVQQIDSSATRSISSVVPDVVENDQRIVNGELSSEEPLPPILRVEVESDAKLLTLEDSEQALNGYRCFVAVTDRTHDEYGDFFLQPHRTAIVWGGQKALFIFQHHSGRFGLYYDMQLPNIVSENSGGASFTTCTIVLKNRIYIPVPDEIREVFIPRSGESTRIEIRCELLYTDDNSLI